MPTSFLQKIFGPALLREEKSDFSGQIRVMKSGRDVYLATGILTQSGGLVREVWAPVLKRLAQGTSLQHKSWLILGLSGGTVAGQISRFNPRKIVGVEIDPLMVSLGKKYLHLDSVPNLEIVIADARKYVQKLDSRTRDPFDFILVDLYLGDQIPSFVYSHRFLASLRRLGRTVIINHLFYDSGKQDRAEKLIASLKPLFPHIRLERHLTNLLIICEA